MSSPSITSPTATSAIIAPSILSSDFSQLAAECRRMIDMGADWLHVDVMDGHFVPNITIGPPIVKSLRPHTQSYLDCHLMIDTPEKWIDDFAAAGANGITFHVESTNDPIGVIEKIRKHQLHVGITLRPSTPLEKILPFVDQVDLVLVMTVEPGFGGQKFMEDQMGKVRVLRAKYPSLAIEVDGGVGPSTIAQCAEAGANVIVSGSAVFGAKDPKAAMKTMRDAVNEAIARRKKKEEEKEI